MPTSIWFGRTRQRVDSTTVYNAFTGFLLRGISIE
jgi:hypothetical protein